MTNKLGDMLKEMRDPNLPIQRQDEIARICNEMSDREEKYKAWLQLDGKIKHSYLDLPFEIIYSHVLAKDTPSIPVVIPETYKHLFVIGSGRNSTAGTGNRAVWAQFNGDTGANYSEQYIRGAGGTASAAELLGHTAGLHLGVYAEASHAAGIAGSFFTFIPHYRSAFFKAALSLSIGPTATGYSNTYFSEFWLSVQPITSMYIYPSAGNFVEGSALSIFGIN